MIKEIKISLMESITPMAENEQKGQGEYVVRSSAKYNPTEYFEDNYRDISENESKNDYLFEKFISSSLDLIHQDLISQTKHPIDSVGIWIRHDDKIMENAIKIDILNDMKKYGEDDVVPIYEFYKMTISKYNVS